MLMRFLGESLNRTLALTILLLAVPLALLVPESLRLIGGPSHVRPLVTCGIPIAAAVIAALLQPPGSRGWLFAGARGTVLRILPFCAAALVADFLYLGAGHGLGWVTFTYGDQGYSGHPARTALWGLPLCLALGVFGWEWALRRTLFVSWAGRAGRGPAFFLSCAVGVALAAPAIVPGLVVPDPAYVAAAFVVAACREVSFASIFASGAGLPAAGIFRGLLAYLDTFVINDWYSVQFPAANYNTSEPRFYLLRAAAAILSGAIVVFGARRARRGGA